MDKSNPLKNNFPQIGFGTYHLEGKSVYQMAQEAYLVGYRHFDTASFYKNEEALGQALKKYERSSFYITSKVWHDDMGYHPVLNAFERSLNKLEMDQIDLFLIHWPHPHDLIMESLEALKELKKQKKISYYGVSNFTIHHLEDALKAGFEVSVNQVEYHPYLNQQKLLDFCDENEIQLIAYCPIARGKIFQDSILKSIASSYNKTVAQVALRWLIQKGIHPIPKSQKAERVQENFDVFDFNLTDHEMVQINQLHQNLRLIEQYYWCHFDY